MKLQSNYKEKIGFILSSLIEASGFNREDFCKALKITSTTLRSILNGKGNYTSNLLFELIKFFGMRPDEIVRLNEIVLPGNFRKFLLNFHSSIKFNIPEGVDEELSIKYMLLCLVKLNMLNDFKKPYEIIGLMTNEFETKGQHIISSELKDLAFCIESKPDPDNSRNNIYKGLPEKIIGYSKEKEYIPSLIQLQREINVEADFEKIYLLSEILLTLSKESLNEKDLIAFIEAGKRTDVMQVFVTPLMDAELISASGAGENKVYQITEKGRRVMNLG